MTAPVCSLPLVTTSPFDRAYGAAVASGWPGEEAFIAVAMMKAAGVAAAEIERLFIDAARRLQ